MQDQSIWNEAKKMFQSGNFSKAEKLAESLKKKHKNHVEILNFLFACAYHQQKYAVALRHIERALKISPISAEFYSNKGLALMGQNRNEQALFWFEKAISLNPETAQYYYNRGVALTGLERTDDALEAFSKTLSLEPDNLDALFNSAICYQMRGEEDLSERAYRQLLDKHPSHFGSVFNYANLLKDQGDYESARILYERALGILPLTEQDFPQTERARKAMVNLALCCLKCGFFEEGLVAYEARLSVSQIMRKHKGVTLPRWTGNRFEKLLILPEQGIGDEVMFASMLSLLDRRQKITVLLDNRLTSLFQRSFEHIEFVGEIETLDIDKFDSAIPLGSLTNLFIKNSDDFTKINNPFIKPDRKYISALSRNLPKNNKFKIGISWNSENKFIGGQKSLQLEQLLETLGSSNTQFINLQYGNVGQEISSAISKTGMDVFIHQDVDLYNDMEGLIALMTHCDIVVTISNVTAHLAGSIGQKTLLMLNKESDWRWLSGHGISPWYPSVEMFSQTKPGDWETVLHQVKDKIAKYQAGSGIAPY